MIEQYEVGYYTIDTIRLSYRQHHVINGGNNDCGCIIGGQHMTIKIEYVLPKEDVLEIHFKHRRNELYNVSYNVSGLSEAEVLELKKEAAAKFCAVFPDVPLKSVLQGFKAVDPLMQEYYKQTFPNGGWRGGGRPKGTNKTESLNQRLTPDEKEFLLLQLKNYRQKKGGGLNPPYYCFSS